MTQLTAQLTPNESAALIWAFIGLVAIIVAIGWYYIQSSLASQKEINKTLVNMRLTQVEHVMDIKKHKDDIKGIKSAIITMDRRQNEFDKDLVVLKNKR